MSKYSALGQFLNLQVGQEIAISFQEIETLLGFRLPKSARSFPPWWANQVDGGHSQCRAWMDAGWRASQVDLAHERLVFRRQGDSPVRGLSEDHRRFDAKSESKAPCLTARLRREDLSLAAQRLLTDYQAELGGDLDKAVARAIHEAALARRGRLIDAIDMIGRRDAGSSVDMIREDRDGR